MIHKVITSLLIIYAVFSYLYLNTFDDYFSRTNEAIKILATSDIETLKLLEQLEPKIEECIKCSE